MLDGVKRNLIRKLFLVTVMIWFVSLFFEDDRRTFNRMASLLIGGAICRDDEDSVKKLALRPFFEANVLPIASTDNKRHYAVREDHKAQVLQRASQDIRIDFYGQEMIGEEGNVALCRTQVVAIFARGASETMFKRTTMRYGVERADDGSIRIRNEMVGFETTWSD